MADILDQIEAARKSLLDLTMRNRLLNFRPNKKRSIRVIDELPNEVYDILVINEKAMEFKPKDEPEARLFDSPENPVSESQDVAKADEENGSHLSTLWRLPSKDTKLADKHVDKYLQTAIDEESLQKRLFYINQQARSVFEEQGYSVLFLALGFLEWKESNDSIEIHKAPLILVPIELERTGVQKAFRLRWTSEEVFFNISLSEKLKEFGVFLPDFHMPEETVGMESFLEQVSAAIARMNGWSVRNDIYLDFFSFTKFVMYKDLDTKSWGSENPITDNSLLSSVLNPVPADSENVGFLPEDMDRKLAMKDLYHIMDADPYQVAVLEDIKSGQNLVVEGPPGTGKSQTIANAIAELLALGKTVLFVSEKMAALEVVKNRLDIAGLGQYCLEIHSRKASKKDVSKELERSTIKTPVKTSNKEDHIDEIELLRSELNDYAYALREPLGKIQKSPFALFQMKEAATRDFEKHGLLIPRRNLERVETYGQEEWNQAIESLRNLKESASLVKPIVKNPWYGTRPGLILPSDEDEIQKKVKSCRNSLVELNQILHSVASLSGVERLQTAHGIELSLHAAEIISEGPIIDKTVLSNPDWNSPNATAKSLIDEISRIQAELPELLILFKDEALSTDVSELLQQVRSKVNSFARIFNYRWWQLIRQIRLMFRTNAPWKTHILMQSLERLERLIEARKELKTNENVGQQFFGRYWKGEQSSTPELTGISNWIVRFRSSVNNGLVTERAFEYLSSSGGTPQLKELIRSGQLLYNDFIELRDGLARRICLDFNKAFGAKESDVDLSVFEFRLHVLEQSIGGLRKWSQYVGSCDRTSSTIGFPLIDLLDKGQLDPDLLLPCFSSNFADCLLREAFKQRLSLGAFIGDLHEKKIARYSELDSLLIRQNRNRLAAILEDRKPQIVGGASKGTEVGILLGEFGRKRAHMPIRRLIKQCGNLIQGIKPCFMMSPLSIAQFLDPHSIKFDVILFDEASQVRPQDALGALLRGTQLVVMGDTRQLPPTSFFDSVVAGDTEEDVESSEAMVSDVESILHQCKRSFRNKLLSWHYRSRHESLIAVSNREFYDNRLLIFPSATDKHESLGLQFVHLPKAVYDRGRSSTNRQEARDVAKAAVDHYQRFPDKSLGVGAFNIRQQQAILEEIELQLIENPEMQEAFSSNRHEHFFVKNLETIQGDERDVIFISVGFGFDENKKLNLNFGPINQAGGERRLNVLTTRAREKCIIFANFRSADLMIDSNAPFGLRALKTYLAFAENRTFPSDELRIEDSDSPFEDSVCEYLTENGYEIRKQVGCASFRIDLAVLDPKLPGTYMAGIECDGQKYHSSPVARDRDRLRQQILEGLGWRIIRIWSTDWYRNRAECQQNLLKSLKTMQKEFRTPLKSSNGKQTEMSRQVGIQTNKPTKPDIEQNNINRPTLLDFVDGYKRCTSLSPLRPTGELHAQSMEKLSIAVVRVVEIESPVHIDEVIRRIRTLWGLSRTGERIQEAVGNSISYAAKHNLLRKKGSFLFKIGFDPVVVRRREGDPLPDLDLICDDEIIQGIKLTLKHLYSALSDDLIVQTSRVFGLLATHEENAKRIGKIVKKLMDDEELELLPNGMIRLAALK